ncbi:MAG: hypothetical protein QGF46_06435, partial [Planctomycetota bacterium]|nr:hypothetical protein [Planctomycetota bacterium]
DAILELEEQVKKLNKKLKGRNALSYVYDWELALHNARKFATSGKTVKKGKVNAIDFAQAPYSVHLPSKYNPKKVNYPCVVLLGAGSADQIESLPKEVLNEAIILAPDISQLSSDSVLTIDAIIAVVAPIARASQAYHLDRMRLFLVGADELGSQLALQWAAVTPHLYTGVATLNDQKDAISSPSNLSLIANQGFEDLATATSWCLEQQRTNPYPSEFEFEIPFAPQSRVFWVHPTKFDSPEDDESTDFAKVKVSVDRETNTISLDCEKVYRVKLYLNDVIVDLDKPITILRNGETYSYQASRSVGTMLEVFASSFDGAVFPAVIQEIDIPQAEDAKE